MIVGRRVRRMERIGVGMVRIVRVVNIRVWKRVGSKGGRRGRGD